MFQGQYNGHASPKKLKQGGLFAVIEDEFYKSNKVDQSNLLRSPSKYYSDSDQIRNDSFNLYSKLVLPSIKTPVRYSNIMDARIGVDNSEPKLSKYESEISQLSKVNAEEKERETQRSNFESVTLKPVDTRLHEARKYDQYSNRNSIRKPYTSDRFRQKATSAPYFKSHKNNYDPFAFQSTTRPKAKQKTVTAKSIFSNRQDSRFSIQVISF